MRRQDWPERLIDFIHSRLNMPFEWGVNDCVTYANGAILAMTDHDLIGMPRWKTAADAVRLLKGMGGMEAVADARFERTTEPQRGDIGLVSGGREFFGIVYPPHVITPGEKHSVMNPLSAGRVFWKVVR